MGRGVGVEVGKGVNEVKNNKYILIHILIQVFLGLSRQILL